MIAEGFILPTGHSQTDNPVLRKPSFGNIGSQSAEFRTVRQFSGKLTGEAGREVYNDKDVCIIKNDKFCSAAILYSDLSYQQREDLAAAYDAFKNEKESNDTRIIDWQAITDQEKGSLLAAGVFTVEQLFAYEASEINKLGPNGQNLKARADMHMATKREEAQSSIAPEIQLLMREKALEKERAEDKEKAYFAAQARIAELEAQLRSDSLRAPKKAGRPKKEIE